MRDETNTFLVGSICECDENDTYFVILLCSKTTKKSSLFAAKLTRLPYLSKYFVILHSTNVILIYMHFSLDIMCWLAVVGFQNPVLREV